MVKGISICLKYALNQLYKSNDIDDVIPLDNVGHKRNHSGSEASITGGYGSVREQRR